MNDQLRRRIRLIVVLLLLLAGVVALAVATGAPVFGVDLTPGFGAWQMFFLMVGLTCITLAGFVFLQRFRPPGAPRSLQADIGVRLSATGLVFAYVSGFADLLGIGTHPHENYPRPFMGWLQITGVAVGIVMILIGMLLYHTSRGSRTSSSLEFLLNSSDHEDERPLETQAGVDPVVSE
jgi:hypothetical protein